MRAVPPPVVTTSSVVSECILPPRMLAAQSTFKLGHISALPSLGSCSFRMKAECPEGKSHYILALIATGAEANLLRRGLFPRHLMRVSPKPLALITANGARMGGGVCEITLGLCFHPSREGEWCTEATFHEADIQVDAILSYSWIKKVQLEVFPHLESLARLSTEGNNEILFMDNWPAAVPDEVEDDDP